MRPLFFCLNLLLLTPALPLAAQTLPFNFIKQWEGLPNESLASLTARAGITVVGASMARLDPGMVVNVVYLQATVEPRGFYRCVEYTREWQMETIQTRCEAAVVPVKTK